MAGKTKFPQSLVFGLDIGTRSIVGTVGYQDNKGFHVVAQSTKFHETRAMIDGQIHDIGVVADEIRVVRAQLEEQLGMELNEVCIAAAGRVLKTAVGSAEYEFNEPTVVNLDYIHSLEMLGVEKAYEQIVKEIAETEKYYCVGYTVVKYYLNGNEMLNLEGHKAVKIAGEILATFLPDEVVDGLYAAVEAAGLTVATLTLEPIAAMNVAIPTNYRLLNICLVDVGAGTSDICVTKDGSIIGYGMIPAAGDEITERILKEYLVDFDTAEKIKMIQPGKKAMAYKDIMGITHNITPDEVYKLVENVVKDITKSVSDKIIELNGGKSVSAVFVVGGGGKLPGFTEALAKHLKLPEERVALRGEEVMSKIDIQVEGVKKDPLLVTPIGICLNYYDQKNNFIYVNVNNERVKLYDNDKLTVFDAAMQMGFKNDDIFPRRGKDLHYVVDGKPRFQRGGQGEAAQIRVNQREASINTPIEANDQIKIDLSTTGEDAKLTLSQLPEYTGTISFWVNEKKIDCPKFASVNGELQSGYYEIQDHDEIRMLSFYTLGQLLTFMDVMPVGMIYVNNEPAEDDEKIYENFKVNWAEQADYDPSVNGDEEEEYEEEDLAAEEESVEGEVSETPAAKAEGDATEVAFESASEEGTKTEAADAQASDNAGTDTDAEAKAEEDASEETEEDRKHGKKNKPFGKRKSKENQTHPMVKRGRPKEVDFSTDGNKPADARTIRVTANSRQYILSGKPNYVFVEIFDAMQFDTSKVKGTELVMTLNDHKAQHFEELHDGDKIEIYWRG